MKTHYRRLFIVFISLIVILGCKSNRKAYSNSAKRTMQKELRHEEKRKRKAIEKRYKDHIKHQSPAMRKLMKKKLRALRKELRRKRR